MSRDLPGVERHAIFWMHIELDIGVRLLILMIEFFRPPSEICWGVVLPLPLPPSEIGCYSLPPLEIDLGSVQKFLGFQFDGSLSVMLVPPSEMAVQCVGVGIGLRRLGTR